MRRTPALIVGAALSGAAAAIGLARAGCPHLLVERTRETGDAICGGFLSWRTLATLAGLGIDTQTLGAAVTQVRLFGGGRVAWSSLPDVAVAVSRRRLDTLLLGAAIGQGAAVERGVEVRTIEHRTARLADGAAIPADALFLASGKHDIRGLARPADARGADPSLGIRVRVGPAPALSRLVGDAIELHLFDRGYAGIVLQEDGSANICLAIHRSRLAAAGGVPALLAALGDESPALGDRLAFMTAQTPADAIANVPYGWRATSGKAGLFRLGDQAGVIPSLAGEGMGIALASGVRAADAYIRGGPGAAVAWQADFARATRRPIAVAGLVRRLAEGRFAPALLRFADPRLIRLLARATRIG